MIPAPANIGKIVTLSTKIKRATPPILTQNNVSGLTTTSSPTFAGETLTGFSGIVQATLGVLSASALVSGDIPNNAANTSGYAGGISIASQAVGDLFYATSATAITRLADVAAGQPLLSGGDDSPRLCRIYL